MCQVAAAAAASHCVQKGGSTGALGLVIILFAQGAETASPSCERDLELHFNSLLAVHPFFLLGQAPDSFSSSIFTPSALFFSGVTSKGNQRS